MANIDWKKVMLNQARGMNPVSAYYKERTDSEKREREEQQRRQRDPRRRPKKHPEDKEI